MKAIVTKFHGPTNTKGSRISAEAEGCPRIYRPKDYGSSNPHRDVAEEYRDLQGWKGRLIEGSLPKGDCVFVFDDGMG